MLKFKKIKTPAGLAFGNTFAKLFGRVTGSLFTKSIPSCEPIMS
jgi:Na+/H+-translocating membrane pyrophosphatase